MCPHMAVPREVAIVGKRTITNFDQSNCLIKAELTSVTTLPPKMVGIFVAGTKKIKVANKAPNHPVTSIKTKASAKLI